MKPIVAGALAAIAALGLLSACGDDVNLTAPTSPTDTTDSAAAPTDTSAIDLPGDLTIPPGLTLPDGSLPIDISGITLPEQVINQMIAQFEAAGMKVDKACFTALLQDESLRKMVEAGGAPNQEAIQKFFTCIST